jgi:hypothetical protein
MLPFLKKPSDHSSVAMVRAWHPNFRNLERLPDTKAIRTSFFVNAMAVFVVFALCVYAGSREYELHVLKGETGDAVSAVQASKKTSDQAVALYKQFEVEEKKVLALKEFLGAIKIVNSDLILRLGETLPPAVVISSIDSKPTGVTLRGVIKGAADQASGLAVSYVEDLRKDEVLSKTFQSVGLTNIVRDPTTGLIQFVIDLSFQTPSAGKAQTKGKK